MSDKSIGNLNGKWSILLRIALATYPLLLSWSIWVTKETFTNYYFRTQGDKFTATDAAALKEELTERINLLPPPDWRARIIVLESRQAEMATDIAALKVLVTENRRILERVEDAIINKRAIK